VFKVLAATVLVALVGVFAGTATSATTADIGKVNATRQAKSYLRVSAFSLKGLIHQLKFEGYSTGDATYGATHAGANWKVQAARQAKAYLKISAFSRQSLIEQLRFEGYTLPQALYGVRAVGY
jgi:hypothetical protein